jgi:hypothetical protein
LNNSRPTRQGAVRLGKQRAQVNSNAATQKLGCFGGRIFGWSTLKFHTAQPLQPGF